MDLQSVLGMSEQLRTPKKWKIQSGVLSQLFLDLRSSIDPSFHRLFVCANHARSTMLLRHIDTAFQPRYIRTGKLPDGIRHHSGLSLCLCSVGATKQRQDFAPLRTVAAGDGISTHEGEIPGRTASTTVDMWNSHVAGTG